MRYNVSLNCPTPLKDKTLQVEAKNEGEAKAKFFEHNGISGSAHELSISEVKRSRKGKSDGDVSSEPQDEPESDRGADQGSNVEEEANVHD